MAAAWVMDKETLRNCYVSVWEHYRDPSIQKIFVIHKLRNDFEELLDFLENTVDNGEYHISFNGLGFDGQITELLLRNRALLSTQDAESIACIIYEKAQKIISNQDGGFKSDYPEYKLSTRQIDLFKMNHWDNPARRSSLKWIQYTLDWPNIQEMPIHHSTWIETMEQIETIISYCVNDVKSTKEVYNRSRGLLEVRQKVKDKYKLKCYSWSNTKLGSELLLQKYCEKTGKKKFDIKIAGTLRGDIPLAGILFPYIEFKTIEFTELFLKFKAAVIKGTKGTFKYSVIFREGKYDYGMGGMHMCTTPGVYTSDDEYIILDVDVSSLYPSIACQNNMYPAHLGPEFYQVYKEDIVDVRLAEKAKGKKGDKAIIDGYKEAANATFGNSNQEHSWLYDPQYLLQTTVNGQLLLSMLVEAISLGLTDSKILQVNTDGVTVKMLKSELNKCYEICKQWESKTKLKLEYAQVKGMCLFDVNNYLLDYEDTSKEVKCKGRFQHANLELHKNKSFLIVPKAIHAFFIENILPEVYLQSNRNIYDYCGGVRVTSDWKLYGTCVVEGQVTEEPLQKVTRYYISNKGCKIVKINSSDNRRINVVAGKYLQTELNRVDTSTPFEEYDINESFYLEQIYKEIALVSKTKNSQLTIFD